MRRRAISWSLVLLAGLLGPGSPARADDERPADMAAVLAGLAEPSAAPGFYVRGEQKMSQGGRSVSLPVTLAAFPVREGEAWAWSLRQEARRKPVLSVEEMVVGRDHRPLHGSVRSEQGAQKQSMTWRLVDGAIRYEVTGPDGTAHQGAERVDGPVIGNGAGLVLFLRQLRPRTGTYKLALLAPDILVAFGLVPMTMEVSLREHDGRKAYVGEAVMQGALRILVALDPETGVLRALESHVLPQRKDMQLLEIRDFGVAEVHNQTSGSLERAGALEPALAEAEAAHEADPTGSAYALRVGSVHRKLAQKAADEAARLAHTLAAGLASLDAAALMAEELRTGRLAQSDAPSFRAMQAGLCGIAGNEILEVLAADLDARVIQGHPRAALELKAAQALLDEATLPGGDGEQSLRLAGDVARGFARQEAARTDASAQALAALAARAYGRLAALTPRDPQTWQDLGEMRFGAQDDAGAIEALERGLELRPKSPLARVYYGGALWRSGRRDEARAQLAILERVGAREQARLLRRLTGMR